MPLGSNRFHHTSKEAIPLIFVGDDWAKDHHDIHLMDAEGARLASRRLPADAGWLVLTHGVGPMRTYRIGAILLDLDNPTRILGQLRQQLPSPAPDEQDGYVPNVFYSCDALVHAETMVLTYGIGDAAIRRRDGFAARTT